MYGASKSGHSGIGTDLVRDFQRGAAVALASSRRQDYKPCLMIALAQYQRLQNGFDR